MGHIKWWKGGTRTSNDRQVATLMPEEPIIVAQHAIRNLPGLTPKETPVEPPQKKQEAKQEIIPPKLKYVLYSHKKPRILSWSRFNIVIEFNQ